MAITLVGTQTNSAAATSVTTASLNTTGANLIAVGVTNFSDSTLPTSITDNKGNTWTLARSQTNSTTQSGAIYYCYSPSVGSGHTFTATFATSRNIYIAVLALAGAQTISGSPIDNTGSIGSGSVNVNPYYNGSAFFALAGTNSSASTAPSGMTLISATANRGCSAYSIQSSASGQGSGFATAANTPTMLVAFYGGGSAATQTITMYPADTTLNRSRSVTLTGTLTHWTSATQFIQNNGFGSFINVTVNASAQTATATWQPGPFVASATITDDTDTATGTAAIHDGFTVSGTNLTSWTSFPDRLFDPVQEFTADCIGHIINISGGTGFTAGQYAIASFNASQNMGAQGTHAVIQLSSAAASGAASGGTYGWLLGNGGTGLSGNNLISWVTAPAWVYDPDAVINSQVNGGVITLSGGTNFNAGTYNVTAFQTGTNLGNQGSQNIALFNTSPRTAVGFSYGGVWAKTGGTTIPTPTVQSSYTGSVNVVFIGDSITFDAAGVPSSTPVTTGSGGSLWYALHTQYPNASSISYISQGYPGTKTTDWLPSAMGGSSSNNFYTAVAAAVANGCNIVSLMIGTNDAGVSGTSSATYLANLQTIVSALWANIPGLKAIVLQEQPALMNGTGGTANTTANTLLQAYVAGYSAITNATKGFSSAVTATITNYAFFLANPQAMSDGIHPNAAGFGELYYTWLQSMINAVKLVPQIGKTPRTWRTRNNRGDNR